MEKLKIDFAYCYGIKKLSHEFSFSNKTFAIYAPNGVMKTSFAKTLSDYANNKDTKDLAFPHRETTRSIKIENNQDLERDSLLIVEPYNEDYQSEKISTLLANSKLKKEYDDIHKSINKSKNEFIKKLKQLSGLSGRKNSIEETIENIFGDSFFNVLLTLEPFVNDTKSLEFHDITYSEIFNDKVLKFLKTKNFKDEIKEYIEKYNQLLEDSTFFKKDFNFYNVETIHKQLESNNFFSAGHSVNLSDGTDKTEYADEESLKTLIEDEKGKILQDDSLKKRFDAIDGKLANADLRQFRDYLLENPNILPNLSELDEFEKALWKAYFVNQKELFSNLLKEYKDGQDTIRELLVKASQEHTHWEESIIVFNNRFVHLPFYLKIKNKEDVILRDDVPTVEFVFKDGGEERVFQESEKKDLLSILSTGEKRALYILNIIFEVEARDRANQETLVIVDDIADSFDYKNKYAIIDYLRHIAETDNFYMIILTHNFDFFRTIVSRNITSYSQSLIAIKVSDGIKLEKAKYINNPFIKDWKNNLSDTKKLMASIPFIRNIIEYTSGENDKYLLLTSLLHSKNNTFDISLEDIKEIFEDTIPNIDFPDISTPPSKVIDVLYQTADDCLVAPEGINLENKIVLSIAIRLKAEEFMKNKIQDTQFLSGLDNSKNQTWQLQKKYTETFNNEKRVIEVIKKVQLITPENIHVNSFMYEPILDMGDSELRELYKSVKNIHTLLIVND